MEAYAALRLLGHGDEAPALRKAREWILAKGGLRNIRVFTRYWLALIGEWPWEKTPNVPPEVIWLPTWFPFCIYNFAQWARATLMPITILSARRASRPLPAANRLGALFPEGCDRFDYELPVKAGAGAWDTFFRTIDRLLHTLQIVGTDLALALWRNAAVRQALNWIVAHQDADGGWGGIQPPWVYGLMALHVEGYANDHPVMTKGIAGLSDSGWRIDEGEATFIQATNSPVWDTILMLVACKDTDELKSHPEADRVEALHVSIRAPAWGATVSVTTAPRSR